MSRRRNRTERPPRVGAAVLAKALAGVFIVFIATRRGVAGAGYLPDPQPTRGAARATPRRAAADRDPGGGAPGGRARRAAHAARARLRPARQELDRRQALGQAEQPHSDTIVLVRLDPEAQPRSRCMSLPRDLAVTIPGYADNTKINQAYDEGGAALTLETVKLLFSNATGRELTINSVIDVNFNGFQRAVNYIDGVYVDVDRHYDNPDGHGLRRDRHPARLPAARRLGRARLRALPPHRLRHLPQRAPAGVPAPGGAASPRSTSSRASAPPRTSWARCAATSASTRSSSRAATSPGMIKTAIYLAVHHAPVNQISLHGHHRVRGPGGRHAPVHLQRAAAEGLRPVHDRRSVDAQPEALDQGQEGPKKQAKASRRQPGSRTPAGWARTWPSSPTPRLKTSRSTSRSTATTGSRYANDTPRVYIAARRAGQAAARLPDRASPPARPASTTASRA